MCYGSNTFICGVNELWLKHIYVWSKFLSYKTAYYVNTGSAKKMYTHFNERKFDVVNLQYISVNTKI